jgi:Flp pilus assembly protein TadG
MQAHRPRPGIRGRSGQGTVEFALVVLLLTTLFFGIIEFSRYFYTRLSLRHVVREAARFAVTGNILPDSDGNPLQRIESIERIILAGNEGFGLAIEPSDISVSPANGGGPGDIVRVGVTYQYQVIAPLLRAAFPDGRLVIRVSSVMKNETF